MYKLLKFVGYLFLVFINIFDTQQVDITRLVSDEGMIPVDAFYNYLTAWYNADSFAYITSQASLIPRPPSWYFKRDTNMRIPRSPDIAYAQMPYYLNGWLNGLYN